MLLAMILLQHVWLPISPALHPSFDLEVMLKMRCPVWISLPRLQGVLLDHAEEIIGLLGRVLYAPK
eukprot:c40653_g1_i1 orf=66-263(+)